MKHGSALIEDRLAGGPVAGVDGRPLSKRQFHRRDLGPQAGGAIRPDSGAVSPRPGGALAGSNDAQLGPALHDDGAGRSALGRRRGHLVRLRPGRGLWLADEHSRLGGADSRFRAAARGHAHDLRHALPSPLAPLGRRRRGDEHGVRQRKGETPHDALAVPPHRAGARLQPNVRHDRVSARRHAAVRRGLFAGRVSHPARRAAEVRAVPRRRPRSRTNGRRPSVATTARPTWGRCKTPGWLGSATALLLPRRSRPPPQRLSRCPWPTPGVRGPSRI